MMRDWNDEHRRWLAQLLWIGRVRGFRLGFVQRTFAARFGFDLPDAALRGELQVADEDVVAFVRTRLAEFLVNQGFDDIERRLVEFDRALSRAATTHEMPVGGRGARVHLRVTDTSLACHVSPHPHRKRVTDDPARVTCRSCYSSQFARLLIAGDAEGLALFPCRRATRGIEA